MYEITIKCSKCSDSLTGYYDLEHPIELKCPKCNLQLFKITQIKGYLYILSNPRMPDIIKIGFTTRNIDERISELNASTGVPEPFIKEATFTSDNPDGYEKLIHTDFSNFRINNSREFFKMKSSTAVESISKILNKEPNFLRESILIIKQQEEKNKRVSKYEEERSRRIRELESKGIFISPTQDTMYSFECKNCQKWFYSRAAKDFYTICPFCFSKDI